MFHYVLYCVATATYTHPTRWVFCRFTSLDQEVPGKPRYHVHPVCGTTGIKNNRLTIQVQYLDKTRDPALSPCGEMARTRRAATDLSTSKTASTF